MNDVIELLKTVDLPYSVRFYGVSDEMFDELVTPDMKAELINGVPVVHSPTSLEHDDIGGFVRFLQRGYADAKRIGKVYGPDGLVVHATGKRFAPDTFFVELSRVPVPRTKEFHGQPDAAIEILSPSNRDGDLLDKRPAYQEAGVGEIWFVDPENREVLIDRLQPDGMYTTETITSGRNMSNVIAGFWIDAD
jgi:Uma2 family endonuclease